MLCCCTWLPLGSTTEVLLHLADLQALQMKSPKRSVGNGSRCDSAEALRVAWKPGGIQVTLRGQLESPNGSTKALKRLQVGSKRRPRGTELAPRGAQEAPRGAQDAPSWLQEAPKSSQVRPRGAQEAPKSPSRCTRRALEEHLKRKRPEPRNLTTVQHF